MGLRINHNISALTSHRALAATDSRLSKNLERLSTGLRINVAADDAAGLTISEKLRTQVRGLTRASLNIQDGISLIQTAEGALDQTQSMLQRMRELAIQSANDTLTSSDRLEIQKEVEQLKDQIDKIAYTTEFNTKKLLDGTSTAVISSSSPHFMEGIAVGSLATYGDYSITVQANGENAGRVQKQRSNIFTKLDGSLATAKTTLESIAQFTDQVGNFILTAPQELYVIADNTQYHFTVSKDLTLQQLADRMSIAINEGLGVSNSTTKVTGVNDITTGAIELKTGKVGRVGDINFTGSEELIKALGFEVTQSSKDAVYTVQATHLEQSITSTVSTKIAGNRVMNLIQGIDLKFEPGRTASITGSIVAQHAVSIDSADNLEFHLIDTDGTSVGIVLYNDSASITLNGTAITVPTVGHTGRYSAAQIVSFFNQAAATTNGVPRYTDNTAIAHHFLATRGPTVLAGSNIFASVGDLNFATGRLSFVLFDGTNSQVVSLSGNHATINSVVASINSQLNRPQLLGSIPDDSSATWALGGGGYLQDFGTNLVSMTITDVLGNSTNVSISGDRTLDATQADAVSAIAASINIQLGLAGISVLAYNNSGQLAFRSTATGGTGSVSITVIDDGSGANVADSQAILGFAANPAVGTGGAVDIRAVAFGDKLVFQKDMSVGDGNGSKVVIRNVGQADNEDTITDNNLRKIGFSFGVAAPVAPAYNGISAAVSLISSFALPTLDFTSIAVGNPGTVSFQISQANLVGVVLDRNYGTKGAMVSHINQQLVNGNSGVRASFPVSLGGNTLQFWVATGPQQFALKDVSLPNELFSDTRDLMKIGFTDGQAHQSTQATVISYPSGGDSNFSIRAGLREDGNISFYYLTEKGSASRITVDVRSGSEANKLGLNSGRTSGVGGTQAIIRAGTNVSTVHFGSNLPAPNGTRGSIVLRVYDQHYDQLNSRNYSTLSFAGTDVNFNINVLKNVFNQQLAQQDSDVRVSVTSAGAFNFYTQGGGGVASVKVTHDPVWYGAFSAGIDVSLGNLGFTGNTGSIKASGTDTSDATGPKVLGVIKSTDRLYGYNVADFDTGPGDALRIRISDGAKTSDVISIPEGELSFGTAFYTGSELVSLFEAVLNAGSIGVNATFDTDERKFTLNSDYIGEAAKIHILESSPGSNNLQRVIGVNPDSYSGVGETQFKIHVKDTSVKFQIGANEKQQITSNIIRTDTTALNIGKVDLTNQRSASEAITLLDKALDIISSERAKLGAIQNRMEYTKTSVDITTENLTSAESRIRDVDFAREVIEQTRNQILMQSSTAQLAQANAVPQTVLQLLQG